MWLDVLLVVLVAALGFAGFRRGGPEAGVRLVGLPLAYGAAFMAGRFGGQAAANALGTAGWIGSAVAGSLGFVAAYAVVAIVALRIRRDTEWVSGASRIVGAFCGLATGLLMALPLLWAANLASGAQAAGVQSGFVDFSGAILPSAAEPVFAAGGRALIDEDADAPARVMARLVSDPAGAVGGAQALVSDPRMQTLQSDPGFWRDVERGAVTSAMARPTFRQLSGDPTFRRQLGDLGLVSDEAVADRRAFDAQLAEVLATVGPRIASIRHDPALQDLLADPEFRARLEAGERLSLLSHPGFRALIGRVTEDLPQ